jgi:phage terminase large subunit
MKRKIYPGQQPKLDTTSQAEVDKFWNRKFNITTILFEKQLAFVQDEAPFKTAVCSRRSGKTIACAADLTHTAINTPNVVVLYITLAASNAKKLIWPAIKKFNEEYKLNGIPNEVELSMTFQNGSTIYLSGAKDKSEIEKFRGLPIKKCYIDECQSFRAHIQDLIDDIIEPALLDHAGTLCLIGTPAPVPTGYFHECAHNNDLWTHHHWTFFDNFELPAIKNDGKTHQQLLDRVLKRRGITTDHPSIQREYFGRWAFDTDSLLIKYKPTVNDFTEINQTLKYNYILGIDVGFKDADALAVLAWSEHDKTTYLVEEVVASKQGLTELVEQIQHLQQKYDISKMVMDMGGLGKKLGEEMIRRYKLPVEPAEKQRKMENIELLNDALRTGRFKARPNSLFAQDTYRLEIDRDKSTPDRTVISSTFHSDIVDAVLYAFKLSPAYTWEPEAKKLQYGSREWAEAQQDSMFELELAGLQQEVMDRKQWGFDE